MKRIMAFTIVFVFLFSASALALPRKHHERYYQNLWCKAHHGQAEVELKNGTRVDCITKDNAIEVDFAEKWYESIGQSLYYGKETGKRPGILLIVEHKEELKFWNRMLQTIKYYKLPITAWIIY